jgi:hypothetical protein
MKKGTIAGIVALIVAGIGVKMYLSPAALVDENRYLNPGGDINIRTSSSSLAGGSRRRKRYQKSKKTKKS